MKFKVSHGILGGHTYSTWEDAVNNSLDSKGRKGTITVEMTSKEYMDFSNSYIEQINQLIGQNNRLREMLKEKDLEYQKKITELTEKDRRCASLAAAVNRLKGKKNKKVLVSYEV